MFRSPKLALPLLTVTALLSCSQGPQSQPSYSIDTLGENAGAAVVTRAYDSAAAVAAAARVRVSFMGDTSGLSDLGVGSVYLCGQGCAQLGTSGTMRALNDGSGAGDMFADVSMSPGRVDRIIVQPDPAKGAAVMFKTIRLDKPFELSAGGRYEVFLSVRQTTGGKLEATYLGMGHVPPGTKAVMAYRPDRAMRSVQAGGLELSMEAGSSSLAQIMSMDSADTGGIAPRITVWPETSLTSKARITLRVDPTRLAKGLTLNDYQLRVGGAVGTPYTVNGDQISFTADTLNNAALFTSRSVVETDKGEREALPLTSALSAEDLKPQNLTSQDTSTCRNRLIANRAAYEQYFTNGTDALKISDCENVAPFVHIVLIDRSKRGRTVALPITPSTTYPGQYVLQPITTHGSGSAVAINGFYWTGDDGTYMGTGYGTPGGTLITAGTVRRKTSSTEAILGFQMQPTDRSQGTSAEFFVGASTSLNFGTHNYNVVGSTASIIKNRACNPALGNESNLWSAAGIGFNRMALVSSVTGSSSTSPELCAVFEGLGYLDGAIRLDGGPSASMAWLGQHINPLSGGLLREIWQCPQYFARHRLEIS